jgi:hypothetical protein
MQASSSGSFIVNVTDWRQVALPHNFQIGLTLRYSSAEAFDFRKQQHKGHTCHLMLLLERDIIGVTQPKLGDVLL